MSDDPSPYASSFAPPPIPPALPTGPPPGQIKVFGILHLTFAALGTLLLISSLAMQGFTKGIYDAQEKMGGAQAAQARLSREMAELMRPITWVQSGLALIVTVFLVLGGLGLLKNRLSGLKWSNAYSWSAIALRLGSMVAMIVLVLPKMNAITGEMLKGSGGGVKMDESVISIFKASMMVSLIIGPLCYCIYPVLTLILLNRKSVRQALT